MKQTINFIEFVSVVEAGSFSKAALELGVSKSHVSKKITQLEERLGVQLLHRSTRKLVLTEIGAIYHQRCKRIMEEIRDTNALILESKEVPQGVLNISLPATLGEQFIVPVLTEFMLQNRQLKLNVKISTRTIDFFDEGMDLAVRIGHLPDSNLMARKLCDTRWIVCASPHYLEEYGTPRSPEELVEHVCLSYGHYGIAEEMNWTFTNAEKKQRYRINPVFVSNNGEAIGAAARNGLGLAYLPELFFADDLAANKLCRVLADYYQDTPITAIYPYSHFVSPKVRLSIDFLVQAFREQQSRL
jgi:DNA-binding transcriptional LysR family regulator